MSDCAVLASPLNERPSWEGEEEEEMVEKREQSVGERRHGDVRKKSLKMISVDS